jgi:uridine kinase
MIIGIGGVSRAGKTTLANQITNWLSFKHIMVLRQDLFVLNTSDFPAIQNVPDWELPQSVNLPVLLKAVHNAMKYNELVIVEGIFAFCFEEINKLYNGGIFIEIDEAVFRNRKVLDKRWGPEPEWYLDHIWRSYLKYGQVPQEIDRVLYVSGNEPFNQANITHFIQQLK